MKNNCIPVAVLEEFLRLDPQSGALYWRERERHHFATKDRCTAFNKKRAGQRADASLFPLNGYARVRFNLDGKRYETLAHRVVFAMTYGRWPDDEIDHIDGLRTNNAPANLRELTHSQNMAAARERQACRRAERLAL